MPGGQTFVVGGLVIAAIFAGGWWLRWDARADQTREVIRKVVDKQDKENQKLLSEVAARNEELADAVVKAREELATKDGYNAELEVRLEQQKQIVIERETRLAAALKRLNVADQSHKCGLTDEDLRALNK
jgi:hypothetical protein